MTSDDDYFIPISGIGFYFKNQRKTPQSTQHDYFQDTTLSS